MRSVGEPVTLRLAWGDPPAPGDVLRMPSGRQYGVLAVRGKRMDCVVLAPDAQPASGEVLPWRWERRYGQRRRATH
jgi:hypothetical protein